jgi:hypothetical protein
MQPPRRNARRTGAAQRTRVRLRTHLVRRLMQSPRNAPTQRGNPPYIDAPNRILRWVPALRPGSKHVTTGADLHDFGLDVHAGVPGLGAVRRPPNHNCLHTGTRPPKLLLGTFNTDELTVGRRLGFGVAEVPAVAVGWAFELVQRSGCD